MPPGSRVGCSWWMRLRLLLLLHFCLLIINPLVSSCPVKCRCMQDYYVYCDAKNISRDHLSDLISTMPKEARYLDLSHNHLDIVPGLIFQRLPSLVQLNLAHNVIANLSVGSFEGLANLHRLDLQANQIGRVSRNTLASLGNLEELHLESNGIRTISESALSNLVNLKTLYLQNNSLRELCHGAFTQLKAIEVLDLSRNSISCLGELTFTGLTKLRQLNLGHNSIGRVAPMTFSGLVSLHVVELDANNIEHITSHSFDKSKEQLQELSLKNNKLMSLTDQNFAGMRRLQKLYLDSNQIGLIGAGTFAGLLELRNLSMPSNKMTQLKRTTFAGASQLSQLHLQDNKISGIATGSFDPFRESLYVLSLSGNSLDTIKFGMFRRMRYLQYLNLAKNSISSIDKKALTDLSNLVELDLSHNKLTSFGVDIIRRLPMLRQLRLHGNMLTEFSGVDFDKFSNLEHVTVNITYTNVTETSVTVEWPYKNGDHIYWSLSVQCMDTSLLTDCPFGQQPEYLAPYKTEVVLDNLSSSSSYYVCVIPSFVFSRATVEQCGVIRTKVAYSASKVTPSVSSSSSQCSNHSCYIMLLWTLFHLAFHCKSYLS